ncbi:MAG: TlpA disulfide reductase family protein [Candidatus Kapabacteria bacterium]|nr:TlpA disulfide reductase family protein [Candidatus Kapabacteria bacterium]
MIVALVSASYLYSCGKEEQTKKQAESPKEAAPASIYQAPQVFPALSVGKAAGKKAADFVWQQDGKQVRFSEYAKGKFVFLNFWGTWCPPCRREIPDIISIARDMSGKDFLVIGIALERSQIVDEAIAGVVKFWNGQGMNYPVIIGNMELAQAYGGIEAVPTTFLINEKGEIVKQITGGRSKEDFMKEINSLKKK